MSPTDITSPGSAADAGRWIRRAAVVALWIVAVVAWRRYQAGTGLGAAGTAQSFIDDLDAAWWGVFAYVTVYLARPIVLFPASILTVVGGVLFGPVVGVAVVVVAANASALLAYGVGRALGRAPGDGAADTATFLDRWSDRLRTNGFETVLVLRLLFVPYDLVNYGCGLLRIPWRPFLVATALGSLPGTVAFVLIGASLERVDQGVEGLDPVVLVAGVAVFVASILVSRSLRRRRGGTTHQAPPTTTELA